MVVVGSRELGTVSLGGDDGKGEGAGARGELEREE